MQCIKDQEERWNLTPGMEISSSRLAWGDQIYEQVNGFHLSRVSSIFVFRKKMLIIVLSLVKLLSVLILWMKERKFQRMKGLSQWMTKG